MLESQRNVVRLLASLDESVGRMRADFPLELALNDHIRGAVTVLLEELTIANEEWLNSQLDEMMVRHGLPITAWIRQKPIASIAGP